jgi:diaminopimelate epimerase
VRIPFALWQGAGNVYVLMDAADLPWPLSGARARALCDARSGIRCDGVLIREPGPRDADDEPFMRIRNVDGSESEMCGNGLRMFARWEATRRGAAPAVIHTLAGPRRPTLLNDGRVAVSMGPARVSGPHHLVVGGTDVEYDLVDVGNPHAVIAHAGAATLDDAPVRSLGPLIERHEAFPRRTNVEWIARDGAAAVRMRVWERGVGETAACGSGAVAVAAVARRRLGTTDPTRVLLEGGELEIAGDPDADLVMTGPAAEIASGALADDLVARMAAEGSGA